MFPFGLLFVPPAFTTGQGRGDGFRFVGLGGPVQELFEFSVRREQALERGVDAVSFGAVGKFAGTSEFKRGTLGERISQ